MFIYRKLWVEDSVNGTNWRFKMKKQKFEILFHKKRCKRYTELQKQAIQNDYYVSKNIKIISRRYNASISSIYRLVRVSCSNKSSMLL